jgi:signal transduction histidine kinase/DNA-binding response OmpR family regulator
MKTDNSANEKKNSVLIVDDERMNISVLKTILSPDYIVYASSDGYEAIETAEEFLPDVILLDIIMSDMDGYAVICKLKTGETTKNIPVIFITGLDTVEAEEKGLALGAADYIPKPFNAGIVKLKVKNQMALVNHTRALDQRLQQQALMTKISHSFLTGTYADSLYSNNIKLVGEFMDIATVLLYKLEKPEDGGSALVCRNEWLKPQLNLSTRIGDRVEVTEVATAYINSLLEGNEGGLCFYSKNAEFSKVINLTREHFTNYITTPIFIKGELDAVLIFSRDSEQDFNENEASLAVLVANVFSSAFERNAIEHDLNTVLKLKSELTTAKELAELSSRAKGDFLSRMSHEMRSPMNAIMGMVQVTQMRGVPSNLKFCFEEIESASRHLLNLIDDILDMSSMEYGTFKLTETVINSKSLFSEIFKSVEHIISEKRQTFTSRVDDNIPEFLVGDAKRLRQVMVCILGNAVKFTPDLGEILFDIAISAEDNDTITFKIEVADNGIGISPSEQKNLFESFEQADGSSSRKYGGIGIGLALTKRIIEMMNGEIYVESELDKGAKFIATCTLQKFSPTKSSYDRLYAEDNEVEEESSSLEGKTILIVEDMAINRVIVKNFLQESGMKTIEAENGKEAVELFETQPQDIDLILMDISMPVMDGYESARKIRESGLSGADNIPILALTVHTESEDIQNANKAGINSLIAKPFDPQRLTNALECYLK